MLHGLMMEYPLTIAAILRRAETLFGHKGIVSRLPDRSLRRGTWAEVGARARRLAAALQGLGVGPGDRVATLGWNHQPHLEAYFGIPLLGAVLHTLNLRLHPDELSYIVNHAGDKIVLVDEVLLPLWHRLAGRVNARAIVVGPEYEGLLDRAGPGLFPPDPPEEQAAALCYTTGTTGRPKGVLYSHRSLSLHSMGLCMGDSFALREADVVLPVVPMFHANAWGLPYAAAMSGATLVLPGPHLDAASLLALLQDERVTFTGGVPTIWLGLLQALDQNPGAYDLSRLRAMAVGGAAAPPALIRGFQERHGLQVIHAWGMTELSPLGTVSVLPSELLGAGAEEQLACRAKQGRPSPFVEVRARGDAGLVPWDGKSAGELEVRGPWVARAYFESAEGGEQFTADGWFRTGDIVTIDQRGYIQIQDRSKDLIKSGGEWISSVALENALMGHPAVAEAAVVAVPHARWQERPLAVVVLKAEQQASAEELRRHLSQHFAPFWLPDRVEFVAEIPRTSAGKFLKSALRERYKDALR